MDVRCDQCGTIYEFEDDRVSATGITVKCTSCGHIFKVFAKTPEPEAPVPVAAAEPPTDTPPPTTAKKEGDKRWLIRKPSGEIFKFKELTTLQQWIVEQKVSREDEISRTGKVWERLGAIKELNPFFDVVDKARAAEAGQAATLLDTGDAASAATLAVDDLATPPPPAQPSAPLMPTPPPIAPQPEPEPEPEQLEPDTQVHVKADLLAEPEPAGAPAEVIEEESEPYTMGDGLADEEDQYDLEAAELKPDTEALAKRPAWEKEKRPRRERDDPTDVVDLLDDEEPRRSGSATRIVLVVVLGIAAGFGGFLLWSKWDRVKELLSGKRNPTQGAYYKGRTLFRLDTEASFQRALTHFDELYRSSSKDVTKTERANARAAQAEIYAAWAQYLRDDAADLEQEAVQKATANPGTGDAAAAELRKRAQGLLNDAKDKASKALSYARHAHGMAENLQTLRALAEATRVAGQPAAAVSKLLDKARARGQKDPELHYTFAMLAYDGGDLAKAHARLRKTIELSNQRTGKPFFRAQMRLARVYVKRGKPNEAITVLQSITQRNPSHARAQKLLSRTKAAAGAVAVRPPPVDAGAPVGTPDAGAPSDPMRPASGGSGGGEPTGDYDTLVRKAERLSYGGNQARAMVLYKKALEKRPGGVEALTGLGYAYMDRGAMGQAIRYFRRALRASGSYGEALIGVAEAYQRSGNKKQALKYYKRYLKHHPAGRRSVLAKQNVKQLEDQLGKTTPMDAPMAMDPPAPMVREPATMDRPAPMVREPPPAMRPAPMRPAPMRPAPMRPAPMVREPPPARGM